MAILSRPLLALGLTLALAFGAASPSRADSAALLAQAQNNDATRYAAMQAKGAEIRGTSDGLSFSLWWQPAGWTAGAGVIVALHGHDGYATTEAALWQPSAEKHGHALLTLQWWFGSGEATSDYYRPDQMYPLIAALLAAKGVRPGTVMFTGYSRGAANSYATAVLDNTTSAAHYFGFVLSNAGGALANYPPNQQITAGAFGSRPFGAMKWGLYCGEKDPDPDQSGCPAMRAARDWVQQYGASVALFIDDASGDHGGFMTNSANVETALATYASLLPGAETECLLDWAEDRFPTVLSPRRATTQLSAPYSYRSYAATRTSVGVSAADQHVWLLDAAGVLTDLGPAANWSAQAGCR